MATDGWPFNARDAVPLGPRFRFKTPFLIRYGLLRWAALKARHCVPRLVMASPARTFWWGAAERMGG